MSSPSFGSYSALLSSTSPSLRYSPSFDQRSTSPTWVSPVRGPASPAFQERAALAPRRLVDGSSGAEDGGLLSPDPVRPGTGLWKNLDLSGQSGGTAGLPDRSMEFISPVNRSGTPGDNLNLMPLPIRSTSPPTLNLVTGQRLQSPPPNTTSFVRDHSPSPPPMSMALEKSLTISPEQLLAKELVSAQAALHELQSQQAQDLVSPENSQYLQLQQSPSSKQLPGLGEQVIRLQGEVSLLGREVVRETDLPGAVTKISESIVRDHIERLRQQLVAVEQAISERESKVENALHKEIEKRTKDSRDEVEKSTSSHVGRECGKLQKVLDERVGSVHSEVSTSMERSCASIRSEMREGFSEAKQGLADLGGELQQRTDGQLQQLKGLDRRLEDSRSKIQELEKVAPKVKHDLEAEIEKLRRKCEELEKRQNEVHDEDAAVVQGLERRLEAQVKLEVSTVKDATAAEIRNAQELHEGAVTDACRSIDERMKEGLKSVTVDLGHRCSTLEKELFSQGEKQTEALNKVEQSGEAGLAEAKRLIEHVEKALPNVEDGCRNEAREQCSKIREAMSREVTRLERQMQEGQAHEQQVVEDAVEKAVQVEAKERAEALGALQEEIRRVKSETRTQVDALAHDEKEKRLQMEEQLKSVEKKDKEASDEMKKLIAASERNVLMKMGESRKEIDGHLQTFAHESREQKHAAEIYAEETKEKLKEVKAAAKDAQANNDELQNDFEQRVKALQSWVERAIETASERMQAKFDDELVKLTAKLENEVQDEVAKVATEQEKRCSDLEAAVHKKEEKMSSRLDTLNTKVVDHEKRMEKVEVGHNAVAQQLPDIVKKCDAKIREVQGNISKDQERILVDTKRFADDTIVELKSAVDNNFRESKESLYEMQQEFQNRLKKLETGAVEFGKKCSERAKEAKEAVHKARDTQKHHLEESLQKIRAEFDEFRKEVKQTTEGGSTGVAEVGIVGTAGMGAITEQMVEELGRAIRDVHKGFREHGQKLHEEVIAREEAVHALETTILEQLAESLNNEKYERDSQMKQLSEAVRKMANSDKRQIGACESMVRKRAQETNQLCQELEVHFRTELGRLENRVLESADAQARIAEKLQEFHHNFDGRYQQTQRTLTLFEDSISATKAQFDNVEADINRQVEGIFKRELAKKVAKACEEKHRMHLDELVDKFDVLQRTLENPSRSVGSAWVPESDDLVGGSPPYVGRAEGIPYGTRGDHPRGKQFQNVMRQALSVQRSLRRCEACPDPI